MSRIVNWDNPGLSFGFPLVGKIKIGEKAKTQQGKEYPKALEHFRCYTDNPVIQAAFDTAIGKRDRLIIAFMSDDASDTCKQEYLLMNKSGKKVATGDGRDFRVWDRKEKGWVSFRCFSKEEAEELMKRFAVGFSEANYEAVWKQRLTLQFLIPELSQVMGCWRFETTAESSIVGIVQTFDTIQNMAGTVIGIPFEISVNMHTAWNESGSRYPVVSMRCAMEGESVRLIHGGRDKMFAALRSGGYRVFTPDEVKALAAGNVPLSLPAGERSDPSLSNEPEELTTDQEAVFADAKAAIESIHAGPDAVDKVYEVYRMYPSLAKVKKFVNLCADAKARLFAQSPI